MKKIIKKMNILRKIGVCMYCIAILIFIVSLILQFHIQISAILSAVLIAIGFLLIDESYDLEQYTL